MLHRLLIAALLLTTTTAFAQKATPSKTTQKQDDAKIDYKQDGAPMPDLLFINYIDTAKKTAATSVQKNDANEPEEKQSRRKKKHHADAVSDEPKKYITSADLDNNANLFIMMFNPTCSHCEDETVRLEKNISLFKKTKVVLVANKTMQPYMHDFIQRLHVDQYPTLMPCIDSTGFIDKVFLYQMLPQINIYDRDRKLLKIYTGEVAIDSLKKYIQ